MDLIRFPENINKNQFLKDFAPNLLECLKISMDSSYKQNLTPEMDDSWYKYLNINLDSGVKYRILMENSRVRGYIVWFYNEDEVQIYDLIIHPFYQCDGTTLRKLLQIFADDIRYKGYSRLIAYTNLKNERMNKLLRKRGFIVRQEHARGTVYVADIKDFLLKFRAKQ
jgi:ribosomal protein S18 acetylase RimI-like enzyme